MWVGVTAVVLCLWFLAHIPAMLWVFIVLAFIPIAAIAAAVVVLIVLPRRQDWGILACCDLVIQQHAPQLARRRAQLLRQDAYGRTITDKWICEIQYFIGHHIRPSLTPSQQARLNRDKERFTSVIAAHIDGFVSLEPAFTSFSPTFTPSEFETFCAVQLRMSGWNAQITQASRDQGVDVIAEKDGVRVVLQCKLYSNPVGNKAVQEIVAGRAHERAHYGAVVTNSTYTTAAEELASTNAILLLHYRDLQQLESLLDLTTTVSAQ